MAHNTMVSVTSEREAITRTVSQAAATAGVRMVEAESQGSVGWSVVDQAADSCQRADIVACVAGEESLAQSAAGSWGARHVVVLPAGGDWLARMFSAADRDSGSGRLVSVLGAPGGAGTSTIALAVGVAAAQRGDALLVDADAVGQGLHAGLSPTGGIAGWRQIDNAARRLDLASVRSALPVVAPGLWLLSGAGPEADLAALPAVCEVGVRGFGHTVIDLGRAWRGGSGTAVLVVRATVAGVMGGRRLAAEIAAVGVSGRLVIRPTGLVPVAEVAAAVGLPVALEVPDCRRLPELWDCGEVLAGSVRRRLLEWGNTILDAA